MACSSISDGDHGERPTPRKKRSAPEGKFGFPTGALLCLDDGLLSYLRHEVAHGLRCLILLLAGGVGVCPQGESYVIVSQHGADGFDVYTVLERQGGEGVPEIVEPKVPQPGVFQDALVQRGHRVRVVHTSGAGGEEPGVAWMLGVFLNKKVYCLLGNGDLPDGEFVQLDIFDPWDRVLRNPSFVVPRRGGANGGFGVQLEPDLQPFRHRVFSGAGDIQLLTFRDGHGQLGFHFCLGPAQPFLMIRLPPWSVVPDGVTPFPVAIRSLANVALAVGSFL